MSNRYLHIYIMLFLTIPSSFAYTLKGWIKESATSLPIIGAAVRVLPLNKGGVSDANGNYELQLPAGEYQIEISMLGFAKQTIKLSLNRDLIRNIYLEESTATLNEVVVDGRRKEQLKRMETGVQYLSSKTIKEIPALFGEVDLIKAIQMLPGIQPAAEGTSAFSVRGGAPSHNLILLDEATVYNANHLMGFFSVFNNDVVKDLTLYKGDLPAAYGGRLASLLDIRTKDELNRSFSIDGGVSLIASRLMIGGKLWGDTLTGYVAGRRSYADLFLKLSPEESLRKTKLYFYDLNGALSWRINAKNRLTLSAYNGRDMFGGDMGTMRFGNSTAALKLNTIFSDRFYTTLSLTGTGYEYFFGSDAIGMSAKWRSKVNSGSLRYHLNWQVDERHKLRMGVVSQLYRFDPAWGQIKQPGQPEMETSVPQKKAFDLSLFAEDQFKLNDRLSLRYGMRYTSFFNVGSGKEYILNNRHELIDTAFYSKGELYNHYYAFEPRLGITFQPTPSSSIKASINHNQQFVHLISTSFAGSPFDFWMPSSPNIRPVKSWQYSVGYFQNLSNDQWELSAEIYYKDLQRVMDYKDHPQLLLNEMIDAELREGQGYGYGLELMVRRNGKKWNGWVSYTFARSFQQVDGVNLNRWYQSPSDRPHNLNIVVNYKPTKRWSLSANWTYVTGQPTTFPEGRMVVGGESFPIYGARNSYRMEAYHRLDLGATYSLTPPNSKSKWWHELNFSIYNAYNRKNVWYINFTEDPTGSGVLHADKLYLFPIIPSVAYNFRF